VGRVRRLPPPPQVPVVGDRLGRHPLVTDRSKRKAPLIN
jgi:hypothetical protein